MRNNMFSIYLHIPFCVRKCLYCDFLSGVYSEEMREAYVCALLRELEREAPFYQNRIAETVFMGGGTPTVLSERQLERIWLALRRLYRISEKAEITTEMNPGTASANKLWLLRELGVNRLSIGLQSDEDGLLKALGRIHTFAQFEEAYDGARQAGFDNINIDLMSALPGQRLSGYERTLNHMVSLSPEHISAYSLILEEGTPFYERRDSLDLPEEEEERQMYELTGSLLREAGYHRYEISNYAKEGYACRHNLAYWKRTGYAGFGLGASSFIEGIRFRNTSSMSVYLTGGHCKEEVQPLTKQEAMEEFMFLGLRCTDGVQGADFYEQFGDTVFQVYGEALCRLKDRGLITQEGDCLRLTERGVDVSNYVFGEFLL